jgi:precorrin-2/cobalt-factor-2 C20-methyltransferase
MSGVLYGIGVGPGDPELLTVKAVRTLERVACVAAPQATAAGSSLALEIVRPYLQAGQEILQLHFPMTHDPVRLAAGWEAATRQISVRLEAGQEVAFLTLGDPGLYSTYFYLQQQIGGQGYPTRIIPGIPAMCAVAAQAGVSLAAGRETLAVVSSVGKTVAQVAAILDGADNVVLLKPAALADGTELTALLAQRGLTERTVMVNRCGQPGERVHYRFDAKLLTEWDYFTTIIIKCKEATP